MIVPLFRSFLSPTTSPSTNSKPECLNRKRGLSYTSITLVSTYIYNGPTPGINSTRIFRLETARLPLLLVLRQSQQHKNRRGKIIPSTESAVVVEAWIPPSGSTVNCKKFNSWSAKTIWNSGGTLLGQTCQNSIQSLTSQSRVN